MDQERYDIVIFGCTGFTGKHMLEAINEIYTSKGKPIGFAVAGRSKEKLKKTLEEVQKRTGMDLTNIPIITADVGDSKSLRTMAKQAKVVVNCCGPYLLLGEPVVEACIAEGAHHLDVSGEPMYMSNLLEKYHKAAEEKGVYIVSACGFDCIPADFGTLLLRNEFPGTLNSVEIYMRIEGGEKSLNIGTWKSLINYMGRFFEKRNLDIAFGSGNSTYKPKLKPRLMPHTAPYLDKPAVLFPTADRWVIEKSQKYFRETENKRPVQTLLYATVKSYLILLPMVIFGLITLLLSQFKFTRDIVIANPRFFSAGFVSAEEPSEEAIKKTTATLILIGQGWKERLLNPDDVYTTSPDQKIVGKLVCHDCGYGFTCSATILAAKMLLSEKEKLPAKGGFYSPAAAFGKTSMREELKNNLLNFEILSP